MSGERRYDPYKNFRFLIAFGTVGAIAYRMGRKWFARTETLYPGVYVEEVPITTKPIDGVVTSTSDPLRPRRSPWLVRRSNAGTPGKRSVRSQL